MLSDFGISHALGRHDDHRDRHGAWHARLPRAGGRPGQAVELRVGRVLARLDVVRDAGGCAAVRRRSQRARASAPSRSWGLPAATTGRGPRAAAARHAGVRSQATARHEVGRRPTLGDARAHGCGTGVRASDGPGRGGRDDRARRRSGGTRFHSRVSVRGDGRGGLGATHRADRTARRGIRAQLHRADRTARRGIRTSTPPPRRPNGSTRHPQHPHPLRRPSAWVERRRCPPWRGSPRARRIPLRSTPRRRRHHPRMPRRRAAAGRTCWSARSWSSASSSRPPHSSSARFG